ncbi:hypothetical protein chiPu_0023020, partial [Chiloscyllium punctatum]|nr:hypothetical protein [Chiloscyllium punctatum]
MAVALVLLVVIDGALVRMGISGEEQEETEMGGEL